MAHVTFHLHHDCDRTVSIDKIFIIKVLVPLHLGDSEPDIRKLFQTFKCNSFFVLK